MDAPCIIAAFTSYSVTILQAGSIFHTDQFVVIQNSNGAS